MLYSLGWWLGDLQGSGGRADIARFASTRGWRTLGLAVRRALALGTRAVFSSFLFQTVPGILILGTPSAGLELIVRRALSSVCIYFRFYSLGDGTQDLGNAK